MNPTIKTPTPTNDGKPGIGMSRKQARTYFQSLSPAEKPIISTEDELIAWMGLFAEGLKAAQAVLPSVCPLEAVASLSPALVRHLIQQTLEKKGNIRPNSSTANIADLKRMIERGISKLDNPKGAMLIAVKGNCLVVNDGFHSLRAHIKENASGNYDIRIRFISVSEAKYFDSMGDNHLSQRKTILQTVLRTSSGAVIKGNAKVQQFAIAKNLNSFDNGLRGCDYKSASDEVAATHAKYRADIEFVTSRAAKDKAPRLAFAEKGYFTKSYVIATMIDALHRFPEDRERIEWFITRYSFENYSDPDDHVAGLLNFIKNPPPTVNNTKTGQEKAIKGSRSAAAIIVNGTSFWLHRYIFDEPARKGKGFVATDTSTYHLLDTEKE